MQVKNDWIRFSSLILVGIVVGWIVANVPIGDPRLRLMFIALFVPIVVFTSLAIGRVRLAGRGVKFPVWRVIWVAVLFVLFAVAGHFIYIQMPVGPWVLVLIAAFGFLFALLKSKWVTRRKTPPQPPPG
jgi:hypothetical protein